MPSYIQLRNTFEQHRQLLLMSLICYRYCEDTKSALMTSICDQRQIISHCTTIDTTGFEPVTPTMSTWIFNIRSSFWTGIKEMQLLVVHPSQSVTDSTVAATSRCHAKGLIVAHAQPNKVTQQRSILGFRQHEWHCFATRGNVLIPVPKS